MSRETPEIAAARRIADEAEALIQRSPAFRQLDAEAQGAIVRDLGTIRRGLAQEQALAQGQGADPYALTLDTPFDRVRRGSAGSTQPAPQNGADGQAQQPAPGPKKQATETLAARAGALVDEIDFPAFVAGLVHSTFDAIVEASIRQMEAFADLVGAVARGVDDFTRDNVTPNHVRDWLREKYPADLELEVPRAGTQGTPKLRPRGAAPSVDGESEGEPNSPAWLADFGLAGEELTDELIEDRLVPAARRKLGENRLQTLSTMVLMGMNRVNVKDGTIAAKVRFRAAARDTARVDYAVGSDPGGRPTWGERGSAAYAAPSTMVSTVGVNAQSDSDLKAELFGEVRINFVSETLPLERFVDLAQLQILQANARAGQGTPAAAAPASPALPAIPAVTPALPAVTPAVPAPGGGAA